MTTLVEVGTRSGVSKRGPRLTPEQKAQQKRERTQARVGLASNALGLTAGAAATGAALRDERFEHGGRVAQRLFKIGEKIPKPIQNLNARLGTKGKAALAGGALALQAGNMGGDVVANRVLARNAATPDKPVKKNISPKNDGTWTEVYISKGDHTSGHGSIDKSFSPEPLMMPSHASMKKKLGKIKPSEFKQHGEFKLSEVKKRSSVSKAYRRYDPEADRQRRLGLAAGAGVGGGLLLGGAAAGKYTTKLGEVDGHRLRGIAVKPKKGKAALLLTGGALASGGLGAAAYRRGLSERNNPWN